MKKCSICQLDKNENEYNFRYKKENRKYNHCKICQKEIRRKAYLKNRNHYLEYEKVKTPLRRQKTREFIIEYKTNKPCKDCNKIYPYYVMDFDHLPQFKKEIKIATDGMHYSKDKLLEEFSKCELVCANCHRERTYKRKNGG